MSQSEFIFATSRPYSSRRKDFNVFGKICWSKELSFNMQAQTQSNWCWAATSTSVSHFYWFLSTWTQCKVANGELGHSDCCNSPVPSACNVTWYLDKALTRTHNFVSKVSGPASFEQVKAEIDAGRPVGARIGWSGGGGHFMVIYGYTTCPLLGTQYYDIDDPIYGKSHLSVSDFTNNYQGSGSWTHTYFTKSYFKLPIKFLIPEEVILRRIWEVRPLLAVKAEAASLGDLAAPRQEEGRPAPSLGIAQRIYSVGLDSLLSEGRLSPQPVGLRVYEIVEDKPQAFFDVSEGEEPRVLQMSSSKNHLDPFARALSQALAIVDQRGREQGAGQGSTAGEDTEVRGAERGRQPAEAELRLFRAPAVNFEALWLNYPGEQQDMLLPLHGFGELAPGNALPFDRAVALLREAARPLAKMDDEMGA